MTTVIAHRGGHDSARENSIAAYRAALADGADGVELDVRLDRRGFPVLAHDVVQWHRGLPYHVGRCSYRWLGFLSTLDEALQVLRTSPGRLVLDVKRADQAIAVAGWCRKRDADLSRIALWCRDPEPVEALRGAGFAERALLSTGADVTAYIDAAAACGSDAVSLNPDLITAAAVDRARDRGLTVYAWITDPAKHRQAVQWGVDGLVTDWVVAARQASTGAE
ncbi:MAG TPA: glycerophosphodiester phosphodiesterase [Mycobacteriales bacterium]|nr:glycerophosphodiester phosphodiesterase [Mycobacteriales bacterium]